MFKAIWAARWYVLLGFFTFLIVLILNTPLHFAWRFAEPALGRMPVKVEQVSGTLWNGHLGFTIPSLRGAGRFDGDWQLSPWQLFTGKAVLNLKVQGDGARAQADVQLSADGQLLLENTSAYVESSLIAPLLKANKVGVAGTFELSRVALTADLNRRALANIAGQLVYSGGNVSFLVDRKPVNAVMPMLIGQLGMESEKAVMNVATTEGLALIQAYLQNDGWGGLAIRRRMLDVLGQKWPAQSTEDTVIFEVSQKVL